jgi:hypothetical protein
LQFSDEFVGNGSKAFKIINRLNKLAKRHGIKAQNLC